MTQTITLGQILSLDRSEDDWRTLRAALGTSDPSTVLSIGDVALASGVTEAIWCLSCIDDPRVRIRAIMPAVKRGMAFAADKHAPVCITAIDRWLDGGDDDELLGARFEARSAWSASAPWSAEERAPRAAATVWVAVVMALAASSENASSDAVAASAEWTSLAAETVASVFAAISEGDRWAERARQRADLIAMFPPVALAGRAAP